MALRRRTLAIAALGLLGALSSCGGAARRGERGPRSVPMAAAAQPAAVLVGRIQAAYAGVDHLRAGFHQEVTNATFGSTRTSDGVVTLARPARMRWDHHRGGVGRALVVSRSVITDGDPLYVIDHAAQRVVVRAAADDVTAVLVGFFLARGALAADFVAELDVSGAFAAGDAVVVALTPKVANPRYRRLYLLVDPATALVRESIVLDDAGDTERVRFDAPDRGGPIDDHWFAFDPATVPGYEVIDVREPAPTSPPP